jgi:hypothetical protein
VSSRDVAPRQVQYDCRSGFKLSAMNTAQVLTDDEPGAILRDGASS